VPITDQDIEKLIQNNTIEQLLAGPDAMPAVADLEPIAAALFKKHNEEVKNDPDRQQEHKLQNYSVTVVDRPASQAAGHTVTKSVTNDIRVINYNGKTMRFTTWSRGKKPAGGYPLYISLHGGGAVASNMDNDEQWVNQMGLWRNAVRLGLYVTPRGIADTADLHFLPEAYVMYDRIIENMIAFEDVDPDKVYVLGFSAGGDGVYQLTAEMSDRFAATNMMAGHPNGVSIDNYKNVPFLIQMGEDDTQYDRHRQAAEYHEKLNTAASSRGGYIHDTFIHPGGTHNNWIEITDGEKKNASGQEQQPNPVIADPVKWLHQSDKSTADKNTNSVLWLRPYTRNANPPDVIWNVKTRARSRTGQIVANGKKFWKSDARARQFYWLDLGTDSSKYADVEASFERADNSISIRKCGGYLRLLVNYKMLDLTRPIRIQIAKDVWLIRPRLSLQTMVKTLVDRGDINYVYPVEIEVKKAPSGDYMVEGGVKLDKPGKSPYLTRVIEDLLMQCLNGTGLWNFGCNNTLAADWLLATPFDALGSPYDGFKQAVAGDYPLFQLSSGNATQPNQQSVPIQATVTRPGGAPAKLLEGHSYRLYEEMYAVMIGANAFLDITTLAPPTGRFLAAIINALTYISNKPEAQRPIVRILYSNWLAVAGDPPDRLQDAKEFLHKIVRNVDPAKKLEVYAGAINAGLETGISTWASSWNHSKIVAADGRAALVGGHNMWDEQYLGKNPVFDVSLKLQGEAATHAQDYADRLWRYALWRMNNSLLDKVQREAGALPLVHTAAFTYDTASQTSTIKESYRLKTDTPRTSFVPDPAGQPAGDIYIRARGKFAQPTGSIPILSIGRDAGADRSHVFPDSSSYLGPADEPADQSIYRLLSLAQDKIRMSLQTFNLTSGTSSDGRLVATWDYRLFYELAKAVSRGVTVEVVLSNPGAIAGGLSPKEALYAGDDVASVNKRLLDVLVRDLYLTADAAKALVDQKLFVGGFRFSTDDGYPDGKGGKTIPLPNHARTFMVDDRVFYVGSQNPYRCNSAEFGYLVEDVDKARSYVANYWTKLWDQSKRTRQQSAATSLEKLENAEATLFILDLLDNQRLSSTWQSAIREYVDAATNAKAPFLATLNDIIANAGYETTADAVLELTKTPFFTNTRPDNQATDESDRFVKDLLTQKALLVDFAALIDSIDGGVATSDTAINQFLSDRKYSCTVLQVYASFAGIRGSSLSYYKGKYAGGVLADGGKSFDFSARRKPGGRLMASVQDVQQGPVLVVESDQSIKLDGVALLQPVYDDGVLSWSRSNGNTTGGSLIFSEIPRSGLLDPFCGVECFGEIEYPDAGAGPLKGKLSFYCRRESDGKNPAQPDAPVGGPVVWPILVSVLLGLALCFSALGGLIYRSRDRSNRKKDKDGDGEGGRDRGYRELASKSQEFEMPETHGAHKRRVKANTDAASADSPNGWAHDAQQGRLKQDVEHFVTQEGAAVNKDQLISTFERQLSELVGQSMTEDDFGNESSQTVDALLESDFVSQVRESMTAAFRDQVAHSVTKSLIERMGQAQYKKFASDSIGAYLEASIGNGLSDPVVSRMNEASSVVGESYLRSLLTAEVVARKAEYVKDPQNKTALQTEVGRQLSSILHDQGTTATEKHDSTVALEQARYDYERTRSQADGARVDKLIEEIDAIEEKEQKLEEDRRETESKRDELDKDKLEEKRREAERKAERGRKEVFERV
jgi:phosphatidylserine/phosphatidylglycerophosphate/cardiolipin synthase-like enzyme